jgi:hypothetical protein
MLRFPIRPGHRYRPHELAIRDLREANGRDPTTGAGIPNHSWVALSLAMVVLDTLSGPGDKN